MTRQMEEVVAAAVEAKDAWERALVTAIVVETTGAGLFQKTELDRVAQTIDKLGEALGDLEEE